MNRQLICTSYNKLQDGSLQLRNNWIEDYNKDTLLLWNIDPFIMEDVKSNKFEFDNIGVSNIQEGLMDLDNVIIHVRILNISYQIT